MEAAGDGAFQVAIEAKHRPEKNTGHVNHAPTKVGGLWLPNPNVIAHPLTVGAS
jgi:hypothetical protein